ncbi:MAG: MFS transporter [Acidobacteria bacterium]|nr:MFS transporter [Acidobacteriota bacterium]
MPMNTLERNRLINQRAITLALCFAGMFMTGFAHMTPLSLLVAIERSLNLTAAQVSVWFNIEIFGMALLGLPIGLAVDRFGPTRTSYMGVILIAIGGLSFNFVQGFRTLWLANGILAVGSIVLGISVPKLVSLWVSNKNMGKGHGLYMTGRSLGSALGAGIIVAIFAEDWRTALRVVGVFLVAGAILWCIFIRRSPAEVAALEVKRTHNLSWSTIVLVLRSRTLWMLTGILFVMMSANVAWNTFGYSFLAKNQMHVFTGPIVMTGIIGAAIGCSFTPALSDRLGRRRICFVYPAILFFVCFLSLAFLKTIPIFGFFVISGLIGFSAGSIAPLIFAVAAESPELGRGVLGVTVGLLLLVGNASGLLVPAIGGYLLGTLQEALVSQYIAIWRFVAGFVLVIGVLAYLLRETGAVSAHGVTAETHADASVQTVPMPGVSDTSL